MTTKPNEGLGMPDNSVEKQNNRFKPGQSGNPKGKPLGTRNAALVALDKLGDDKAKDIVEATIKAAIAGDMAAARVLLDRIWPTRKGRPAPLNLPPLTDAVGVVQAIANIAEATASGEITPDEAQAYIAIIETQRRAIETSDFDKRLAALETLSRKDK